MKKILLLLILIIAQTSAQNLIEIFEEDIPKSLIEKSEMKVLIEANINALSKLNPELLHYYFKALNEYASDDEGKKEYKRIMNFLALEKQKEVNNKINWINSQLELLSNYEKNSHYRNITARYFYDLMPDSINILNERITTIKENKNLYNYFISKWLSKDSGMRLDIQKDYSVTKNNVVSKIIDEMNNSFDELKNNMNAESDYEDFVDHVFDHWFLFKDFNSDISFQAYELISEIVRRRFSYSENNRNRFRVSFGFRKNNLANLDYKISIDEMNYSLNYSFSTDMTQLFFSIGYNILMKEHKTFLSEINVSLSYLKGTGNKTYQLTSPLTALPPYKGLQEIYNVVNFREKLDLVRMNSQNSLLFSIESPMLFISKDFFISAGVTAMFNSIDYSVDNSYYYSKLERGSLLGGGTWIDVLVRGFDSHKADNLKYEEWFIVPLFSINYSLPNGLIFTAKAFNQYYGIQIGYEFL